MRACQVGNVRRLLVDGTQFSHDPMTVTDRVRLASALWMFWDQAIRVAFLGRPDQLDPEDFDAVAAQNRGLPFRFYTNEAEALTWLLKGGPPKVPSPQ